MSEKNEREREREKLKRNSSFHLVEYLKELTEEGC